MNGPIRVTAVVGSYRKGGVIHHAVDEILASAKGNGAEVTKIDLLDKHIEFCTNCRSCTQREGVNRGECLLEDEMSSILAEIERSDALILASPMNFWTVTAVMKRFIERLICYGYWPWKGASPKNRIIQKNKRAVLVMSSAAPSIMARLLSSMVSLLKTAAGVMGAKTVGILFIGLCAQESHYQLSERIKKKARRMGKKLAEPRS